MTCPFCGSSRHFKVYGNLYNRRKPDFGPFDFYECDCCGSGLTLPPPSADDLAALYDSLTFGMSPLTRELLADEPEATWHKTCLEHLVELSGRKPDDKFTWVDIGAGAGEMAAALGRLFPAAKGVALDIHDQPPALSSTKIEWIKIDVANDDFAQTMGGQAELVFAVGVWEHVRRPDVFLRNAISLMAPRSMLYLNTPNYNSWARRLMGERWPYFYPGEHIFMPSLAGARLALDREAARVRDPQARMRILVRPVNLLFSLRYVVAKLVTPRLATLVPRGLACKLPAGDLEAMLWLE